MLTFSSHLDGYHDVADQMIHHLRRRAEAAFRRRDREREGLRSVGDFEAYRARQRANFLRAIGGLPEERTPLNASVTGTLDRGRFTIEKLVFYSLPEYPVTAALYLPHARRGGPPGPAVLFVCGHALEAKGCPGYQRVCAELARDGFVVLAVDPLGQGERFQHLDPATGEQRVGWGTTEHTYAGLKFYLSGMSIARHFVWDGIRALDYLLTRPEVDPRRIGVTGNSGGGTQSSFLMLAEPRLAAAMPCTWIMDYESYLATGQPQDGEQNLWGCFADGPDHDDYLTAMAPKPVRIGLAAYDFFPLEGALASLERAKKLYALYGADAAERLDAAIAPTTHTYGAHLRQAAVNFFRKTLRGEPETFVTEEAEVPPPEALHATCTGQVLTSFPGCPTVSEWLRRELKRRLSASFPRRDPQLIRDDLAAALGIGKDVPEGEASVAGGPRRRPIYPRIIEDRIVQGYRTEKIFFFTEPGICAAAILSHPRGAGQAEGTDVLLFESGTDAIPDEQARLKDLLERGRNVCVLDVRGSGAVKSRPLNPHQGCHHNEFVLGCNAFKLKTSTLGLRVFDVLRALDYLRSRADAGPLRLTGVGVAAPCALYAAALDPAVAGVSVERLPLSLRACAEAEYYDPACLTFRSIAWGLLPAGELAGLLPALAPRPVLLDRPVSPAGTTVDAATAAAFLKAAEGQHGSWRPEFRW